MTIFERLETDIKAAGSNRLVTVNRNDLSNALRALQETAERFGDCCGCIDSPKSLFAVMRRQINYDE